MFEHHILRHQEDGQVERESWVAGDVCNKDLATLGRQLVDERGAKFGPGVRIICITGNACITRTVDSALLGEPVPNVKLGLISNRPA